MNWHNVLDIWISDQYGLNVELGASLIIFVVALVIFFTIVRFFRPRGLFFNDTELNITLGGIGSIKIKTNSEIAQIAHGAWTELITRKAGLPLDIDHDLIIEVYNSWYQLFIEMRLLIRQIPAGQLKDKNTKKLVELLIESLNKGLRPHLTKWQARFRRWYEAEMDRRGFDDVPPQEIQKLYPHYQDLMNDMRIINQQLVDYTAQIKKLVS